MRHAMMKKTYIIPCLNLMQAQAEQMLAYSGVISNNNDINIDYGGIDLDGSVTPDVKQHKNIWDDEW